MSTLKAKQGFTLLEILLVMVLISVLITIIITAINPNRQLAQARDAERVSEIRKISNALDLYATNNGGVYPEGLTSWYQDICSLDGGVDCVDLSVLVPTYLDEIPLDPDGVTRYKVGVDGNTGQVSIQSPVAEQVSQIVVNPLPAIATFAKKIGGLGFDEAWTVEYFTDGSSLVSGGFQNELILGAGEPDSITLTSAGNWDIFTAKYSPSGSLLWARQAGGTGEDRGGFGVTTFSDGSSAVIGYFTGTATFGEGDVNETVLVSAAVADIFLAKYNPSGTLAWVELIGGPRGEFGYGIGALPDGGVVITGAIEGTTTFGAGDPNQTILSTAPGIFDMFVARYNADGDLSWARQAGGSSVDWARDLETFSDGSSIVAGFFNGTAVFGQGDPNQTTIVSAGAEDLFIAKYNPDGTLAWARRAGGSGTNFAEIAYSIDTFNDGSSIMSGVFVNTATFGQGDPNQTTLISEGDNDFFIAKYNSDGTLAWAKRSGGVTDTANNNHHNSVSVFPDNSVVFTGTFQGTAVFGQGDPNQTTVVSAGVEDLFIAKYNPDGTLAWARRAGGSGTDTAKGISAFGDGSFMVTGWFNGSAIFGQGDANQTTLVSDGDTDIFLAKYNQDGRLE